MTRQARAVVIGGGIMGVSVAYHLAAEGWTEVVLCEKSELTSGSTWHAAGQIAHAVDSRTMGWVNDYSIRLYRRLEREPARRSAGMAAAACASDTTKKKWIG